MTSLTRRLGLAVAVLGLMAGVAGQARAGLVTGFGDPLSVIPGGTQVNFSSPGNGNYGSVGYDGVTIQGVGGPIRIDTLFANNYNTTGAYLDNNAGATTTIDFIFDGTVDAFAFNFGASDVVWNLTAFDQSDSVIESHALAPPTFGSNDKKFFGIQAGGIARARLTHSGGDYVMLDNLTFSPQVAAVPEPSTFISGGLAGIFGLGLAWRNRRRKLMVAA